MIYKHCPICGELLTQINISNETDVKKCMRCQRVFFPSSAACIICIIVDDYNNTIVIKQNYVSNYYILVAGYIKEKENITEAAIREIKEELNIDCYDVNIFSSYYYNKKDLLMIAVVCRAKSLDYRLSDEVQEARITTLNESIQLLSETSIAKKFMSEYLNTLKK